MTSYIINQLFFPFRHVYKLKIKLNANYSTHYHVFGCDNYNKITKIYRGDLTYVSAKLSITEFFIIYCVSINFRKAKVIINLKMLFLHIHYNDMQVLGNFIIKVK